MLATLQEKVGICSKFGFEKVYNLHHFCSLFTYVWRCSIYRKDTLLKMIGK